MHRTEKALRWVAGIGPQGSSDQVRGAHSQKMQRCRALTFRPSPFFHRNLSKIQIGTPPCEQGQAFQAHSLQIIL